MLTLLVDVYSQFLEIMQNGHPDQYVPPGIFLASDLPNFNANILLLPTILDQPFIQPADVLGFLSSAHPALAERITAAGTHIIAVVQAAACFPFSSPVPLTPDALLRAATLLTNRGPHIFQSSSTSMSVVTLRKRETSDQLRFLFEALAVPRGQPTSRLYEDILDVLTRLPFPVYRNPTMRVPKPRESFKDMAVRLEPSLSYAGLTVPPVLDSTLALDWDPWFRLVAGLQNRELKTIDEALFLPGNQVDLDCFLRWGDEIRLLETLHILFDTLFQPCLANEKSYIE